MSLRKKRPPPTAAADDPARASNPAPAAVLAPLGLHGLAHLDAPVLAALASEAPMLLIGAHGSAKSAMLERIAAALGLEHRHYNASLLSFDDLVGFPVPDGDALRYLRTPATLWGAHSVFLDEISRCRPEVQNKLFSIVHEKRVQGVALHELRYRWAAMNPPADEALGDEDDSDTYAGSLPLDTALADRFAFVLPLPSLDDLSPEARRALIRDGLGVAPVPAPARPLPELVDAARAAWPVSATLHAEWITAYVAATVVPLRQAGLGISGRRAAMLASAVAAVHAARRVLGGDGVTPEGSARGDIALPDSALVALRHALPQRAQGRSIDPALLLDVHRKAADAATQDGGDPLLSRILDETDPVRRVGLALAGLRRDRKRVPRHTMSLLVADALTSLGKQARWILGQELLPELVALDAVDAATLELLAEGFAAQLHLEDRPNLRHELPRSRMPAFEALLGALGSLDASDPAQVALGNLGAALYAADEAASDPKRLLAQRNALRTRLRPRRGHEA